MSAVKILSESDLRSVITIDLESINAIENCFRILATEPVIMPPILRLDIHENNGEVDVKTAYLPGLDSFAIKISPGFFNNPQLGLPSTSGLMVLLSAKTGVLENVLLDNGYLTDVRTAAAGAVSVNHLANKEASRIGIVGSGQQAFLQLKATSFVRDLSHVFVWARDQDKAAQFIARVKADNTLSHLECLVCKNMDELAAQSDIIITTTPSSIPIIKSHHLKPGMHITAMGSDAEHKNEIDADIFSLINESDAVNNLNVSYFCDKLSQVRILGELHHAIEKSIVTSDEQFSELGEVVAGLKPGRISVDQITICDLTGTGAQDTTIATLARIKSEKENSGTVFKS